MPWGIFIIILKYQKKYREGQEVPEKMDTDDLDFWIQVVFNDTLDAATLPKISLAVHCLEMHKKK